MRHEPEVVRVYASSLLLAATETGKLAQYVEEARVLRQIYLQESRMRAFLEGPHVLETNKTELVTSVFKGRVLPLYYNLLRLLIDKKRIALLAAILEEFRVRGEEKLGILVGRVKTATPLDTAQRKRIQDSLEKAVGMKFTLDFDVDASLLGGVLVTYQDVRIDSTLRGRLDALKSELRKWA